MKNILFLDKACTGCMVCEKICPTHAISLVWKKKRGGGGYWYPHIDNCISCGKCLSVCPVLNSEVNKEKMEQTAFIAYHVDINERKKSTSGGLFLAIASHVIRQGGSVFGAAYNDEFKVVHRRATTLEEVESFRGSKYVQSDIRFVFQQIVDDLDNKLVLFSGTPCQISAVKSYCKQIDTHNLVLCEILCYGVPSPDMFSKHLDNIESHYKSKLCNYVFRDEREGWSQNYIHSVYLQDGRNIYNDTIVQSLEILYRSHYNIRPSCFECRYIGKERCADITIGDCWGAKEITAEFDSTYGISLALVNTSKGMKVWAEVENDLHSEEIDYDKLTHSNGVLMHGPEKPTDYDIFWKKYMKNGYLYILRSYTPFGGLRFRINRKIRRIMERIRKS